MAVYLIDDEILFSPKQRQLMSLKKRYPLNNVIIHSTGARCLELILEKQSQTVSQSELMITGWGEDAIRTISNASYYQCFVNLRKAFRTLDYEKEIFTTVRGQGVRLSSEISIRIEEQDISVTIMDNKEPSAENKFGEEIQDSINTANNDGSLENCPDTSKGAVTSRIRWAMVIFVIGSLFIMAYLLWSDFIKKDFVLDGYAQHTNSPTCFYFNPNNADIDFVIAFMAKKKYSCDNGNDIFFISFFATSPRFNIFKCNRVSNSGLGCSSETYILDEND